jgi:hypothetical protein
MNGTMPVTRARIHDAVMEVMGPSQSQVEQHK